MNPKNTEEHWSGVTKIARLLHDEYEAYSVKAGWKTQDATRVPFEKLPEANKEVMIYIAGLVHFEIQRREAQAAHDAAKSIADKARLYPCEVVGFSGEIINCKHQACATGRAVAEAIVSAAEPYLKRV